MHRRTAEFPASAEIHPLNGATAESEFDPVQMGQLNALEKALKGRRTNLARHRYLLLFRFVLINMAGFALLGAAHLQGWVRPGSVHSLFRPLRVAAGEGAQ